MTLDDPRDELFVGDQYYILASSIAADLPRLVLKHDEAFMAADRRGDFPGVAEFGFYAGGTRFLNQLELRVASRWSRAARSSTDELSVAEPSPATRSASGRAVTITAAAPSQIGEQSLRVSGVATGRLRAAS